MNATTSIHLPSCTSKGRRTCLACGALLHSRQRRYCSMLCRQNLLLSLNRRTGLLRALNTRYATFSFNDWTICMDLLPYGLELIHSYLLPRSPGKKPVDDFCTLCNVLGTAWWDEKKRTHKSYRASQVILDRAVALNKSKEAVIPHALNLPSIGSSNLVRLDLRVADLMARADIETSIKQAYRRQAKKHHPDLGGEGTGVSKNSRSI